ncbi:thiosulfate oxidation carrier complex protein SoxZ [endosymbiont of Ridgeia piscesae]|jgi:sulfur-oxidizing protein SoxZ|uniref:Sulfur compound chelating protein SoxZ n=1 Tax=endosymbiont of Ridgeia piscesae TaxID=54398 RepID=A0A0T5YZC0_9GAMM|nr:thiosulfate oxidation carrier complex protein SoxZ [endosymbiont of Ridgeia piscesae]KRT55614.1 sulfur compound chelating protein SoxZ [endosymbiont of Ridgeia piscesae]KRT58259.1 sulfur compound chelating protein SoxZ [endosymbiont of Ridgeia piscesae]
MAKSSIKIRAKAKGDVTTVKALMTHPMETGGRKDKKTGKLIPAHFIQEITCKHKGNTVITALFSGGVSKNPYLSFKFTGGAKGDEIELSWSDNKGGSDSKVAKIK